MSKKRTDLTDEELERQDGEPLPERTQMSVMHPPGAGPQIGAFEVFPDPHDPVVQPGPVEE
jgi:hypothetical protein